MKRIETSLVDDLDGTDDSTVATTRFGLDGVEYEVDLGAVSRGALDEFLGPYLMAARKVPSRGRGRAARSTSPASADTGEAGRIRSWAREQGVEVSERGRISGAVKERYRAAHGG